ncbi:MAG TPA: hypothetical protein VGF99_07430, partial [Myxococcota bacterium]
MRRRYIPFFKCVAETLLASVRVIGNDAIDECTAAEGDVILARWSSKIFAYGNVDLRVYGADAYADARPHDDGVGGAAYVVMTNHQSLLDI